MRGVSGGGANWGVGSGRGRAYVARAHSGGLIAPAPLTPRTRLLEPSNYTWTCFKTKRAVDNARAETLHVLENTEVGNLYKSETGTNRHFAILEQFTKFLL